MRRSVVLAFSVVALAVHVAPRAATAQGRDTAKVTGRADSLAKISGRAADSMAKVAADSGDVLQSLEPGAGFPLVTTDYGSLSFSAYVLFRFLDQLPGVQSYQDHLGNTHVIDTRQDLQWHRVMFFFKGWIYDKRFNYNVASWTVNSTGQLALIGNLRFRFNKHVELAAGINGLPGTRTLRGSHPFWLGHDRVMSDEFIRPGFTSGAWAEGEAVPRVFYNLMVGSNISQLGITGGEDSRFLAWGGSVWSYPTTGEFGPRGGFGDFEVHQKLATRIGASAVRSRENRFTQVNQGPEPTQIKMQDALNLFEANALANGVTVIDATYRELGLDAAAKYKGFFVATEFGNRWLDNFNADGPLPMTSIHDWGFYVQTSYIFKPENVEPYLSTSWVYGDKSVGYSTSSEVVLGLNWLPFDRRNVRLDVQFINVKKSPVSSIFGYYVGGLTGQILSFDWSLLF